MADSQKTTAPRMVRFWAAVADTAKRIWELLAGRLYLLLVPFLLTADAIRVVLWHISILVQRKVFRQERVALGPCCDPAIEHITVGSERIPLCPFALKYRGRLLVRILCGNAGIVPYPKGGKVCICARDLFSPAFPRWALGACLLTCMWVVVMAGSFWGIRNGSALLGLPPRGSAQQLPDIDEKSAHVSESERSTALAYVRRAREYMEGKRYSAARIEYRNAMKRDPLLIEAYTGLAECCLQLGFFGEAKEALNRVVALAPSSPTAYRRLTELAYKQRDFQQALVHARKLCELQPKDKDASLLLSSCHIATGDTTNAMREVSRAISLAPNAPDPYVTAAYIELLQDHPDIAETHYRAALRLCSTNVAARIGLAVICGRGGKIDEAVKILNGALEDNPGSVDAILALGKIHCARGAAAEAVALYRKQTAWYPKLFPVKAELASLLLSMGRINEGYNVAVELNEADPGNVSAALVLSDMFLNLGLTTLAEDYARKALRGNPNIIEGHKLMARIVMKRGDNERSLAYLKRIAQVLPEDLEMQLRLAFCLEVKKEAGKAEQTLRALATRYPESPLPYLHLGEFYNRQKQVDKAIASYRQAIGKKPESEAVLNDLASLLLDHRKDDQGAVDEAFRLASRAWQLAPDSPAMADTLGWAHCRKGNFGEALILLTFAQSRVPSNPEVLYHLACAMKGKGMPEQAKVQLEAAFAVSKDFAGAEAARAMLEEINRQRGDR